MFVYSLGNVLYLVDENWSVQSAKPNLNLDLVFRVIRKF